MKFLPIPDEMPLYLFAPHPLSGTMLKPFEEHEPKTAQQVTPDRGDQPVALAHVAEPEAPAPETTASVTPALPVPPPAAAAAPAQKLASVPPADMVPPPPAPPRAPTEGTVTVIVENVESAGGTVNIALCNKGLSHEGCPYSHEVHASPGFVETEFDDIPPGKYAVVGYHDVNGNNQFDKLFGMPREPYALSGEAGHMLVPTFKDAALPINPGENSVVIQLKRLGGG
jgi:uncharacterized protein (DUF2141 family)